MVTITPASPTAPNLAGILRLRALDSFAKLRHLRRGFATAWCRRSCPPRREMRKAVLITDPIPYRERRRTAAARCNGSPILVRHPRTNHTWIRIDLYVENARLGIECSARPIGAAEHAWAHDRAFRAGRRKQRTHPHLLQSGDGFFVKFGSQIERVVERHTLWSEGTGFEGTGCVGQAFSPGTSLARTAVSWIGQTGFPVTRSNTKT